jgi:hypothetical protein
MMGWDQNVLQRALDQCVDPSGMIERCSAFNVDYSQYNTCQYNAPKIAAVERCADPRSNLCGSGGQPSGPPPAAPPPPAHINPQSEANVRIPNFKVVYETVTKEEFVTTTLWEKRSVPTGASTHEDLRVRFADIHNHHQHHHNAHANGR